VFSRNDSSKGSLQTSYTTYSTQIYDSNKNEFNGKQIDIINYIN
ncbi:MAG: hypothetical protein ACI8RD_004556, partial [Bacillariaceae sp.]